MNNGKRFYSVAPGDACGFEFVVLTDTRTLYAGNFYAVVVRVDSEAKANELAKAYNAIEVNEEQRDLLLTLAIAEGGLEEDALAIHLKKPAVYEKLKSMKLIDMLLIASIELAVFEQSMELDFK